MRHHFAGALTLAITSAATADISGVDTASSQELAAAHAASAPEGDIFESAAAHAADLRFDFAGEINLCDIDLIEALGREPSVVTLIARAGPVHTYAVAPRPSYDAALYGPAAYDPLDLAMFTRPRTSPGAAIDSFLPPLTGGAMQLELRLAHPYRNDHGFIPAPGSALLAVMGAAVFVQRRRR